MLARESDVAGAAGVLAAQGAPRGAAHAPLYCFICEGVLALGAGVDPAQVGLGFAGNTCPLSWCALLRVFIYINVLRTAMKLAKGVKHMMKEPLSEGQ